MRKPRGFWKKLFLFSGFLGIVYYLVWKESNNPGNDDDDEDDKDDNQKGKNKNKQKEKNGYLLLNNNEDLDI